MNWLRLHHSVLINPKVQKLEDNEFKAWVNMLIVASSREPRGSLPSDEDLAFSLRLRAPFVSRLMVKLERSGLVDNKNGVRVMHDWDEHQPQSDDINQRVRAHRERKRNVTGNVTDTVQIENRTDTEQSSTKTSVREVVETLREAAPKTGTARERGSRLSIEVLPPEWAEYAAKEYRWDPDRIAKLFENFRNYWTALPGKNARKLDWFATWRNRCQQVDEATGAPGMAPQFRMNGTNLQQVGGYKPGRQIVIERPLD